MTPLFNLVGGILAAFYAAIPNYAVAIILLTILVMAITTPLTLKSTRSMMMMQQLQPEMKRIQARFKDDRQRANEEMLKFYKDNNINPLGGCIPLLVQMPVFFFLYAVLRGLTRRVSDMGFAPGFTAGQNATGAALSVPPVDLLPFDPAYIDHSSAMYQSLSHTTTMSAPPLNVDLSESMTQAWSRGVWAALPYVILIAIVGVTSFYQQRQIQGRNPNQQINPQTQTMMKIMPIILPVISLSLPAGLVLYFAVSNLWRVGLQGFISRSIYGIKRGDKPSGGDDTKAGAGRKGLGGGGGGKAKAPPDGDEELAAAGAKTGGNGRNGAKSGGSTPGRGPTKKPVKTNGTAAAKGKTQNGAKATNGQKSSAKSAGSNRGATPRNGGARTGDTKPSGSKPSGTKPSGSKPSGTKPSDTKPSGTKPSGTSPGSSTTKSSPSTDRGASNGQPASPALQPRARRPKKR